MHPCFFSKKQIENTKHGKLLHEELIRRVYILWHGVNIAIFTKTSSVVYIMDRNTSEHSKRFHVKVLNVDGSRRNLFFQKCWMNSNFFTTNMSLTAFQNALSNDKIPFKIFVVNNSIFNDQNWILNGILVSCKILNVTFVIKNAFFKQ